MKIVRQKLFYLHYSVQRVLSILSSCTGIFWTKSYNKSTVGVFPKYQIIGLDYFSTKIYQRNGLVQQEKILKQNCKTVLMHYWSSVQCTAPLKNQRIGFTGGLIGFIGYDIAAHQSVVLTNHASPTAIFADYDIFLQQEADGWQLYGPDCAELQSVYDYIEKLFDQYEASRSYLSALTGYTLTVIQPFQPLWTFAQYQQAFNQVQDYLLSGDCYQINLTQAFKARVTGHLLGHLDALQDLTKASYAGYTRYENFELLSCSPELFLEFNTQRQVITRPIKGTRPRHIDPDIDAQLKAELLNSEKDRSENLMIVDLLRNDLSVYAKTGSVHVPALFEIESFAQVHHLVSEIRATLADDVSPIEVLFAALPGGSITGAPKIRAMQIINELEAEPRGAYCGSMGYLNYDGTGVFNILIRTLQRHDDTLTAWAGGGITVASTCMDEYQECLDKIGAILASINELAD